MFKYNPFTCYVFVICRKFKCPYCEYTTIQQKSITQHMSASHPGLKVKYVAFSAQDLERKIAENIIFACACL